MTTVTAPRVLRAPPQDTVPKSLVRSRVTWTIVALLVSSVTIAVVRLNALGWDIEFLLPDTVYDVDLVQRFDGRGEPLTLTTFLPEADPRQAVLDELSHSADVPLKIEERDGNRVAEWTAAGIAGSRELVYHYRVRTEAVRYELSPELALGTGGSDTPAPVAPELTAATRTIQSDAPEIVALARTLVPADGRLAGFLRAVFDRVQSLGYKPFKGTTDALTALRLGEASCNGRARLMVALLRAEGVPARLVGGLVLEPGTKRTSHQWLEVSIAHHWVPMDPTNHHFAELPHDYLTLYRGDEVLFTHTSDIAYQFEFRMAEHLVPREQARSRRAALGIWGVFDQLGIPLELLKIVIMLPVAAVVVVIFRNVLGLRTFGTFLPALIAAAAVQTGFLWGATAFLAIILITAFVRRLTAKLQLLHSPQLGVLLTTVIGLMLATSWIAASAGDRSLGRVALFPVAILAITAERFVLVSAEEGAKEAWKTMARTLVVVFVCYLTMGSLSLQILLLSFPELLLVLIAIDIWLGRWMGLRMTEWLRFKGLLLGARPAAVTR